MTATIGFQAHIIESTVGEDTNHMKSCSWFLYILVTPWRECRDVMDILAFQVVVFPSSLSVQWNSNWENLFSCTKLQPCAQFSTRYHYPQLRAFSVWRQAKPQPVWAELCRMEHPWAVGRQSQSLGSSLHWATVLARAIVCLGSAGFPSHILLLVIERARTKIFPCTSILTLPFARSLLHSVC